MGITASTPFEKNSTPNRERHQLAKTGAVWIGLEQGGSAASDILDEIGAAGGLGVGGVAGFVDSGALRKKGCRIFAVFRQQENLGFIHYSSPFHRAEEDET